MPQIKQLPQSVVNKIAAGEVIERPASVVKELVENSLDAGASRIDVFLANGGGELIRITDNGCGIAPDELPLAVAAHATSKIRDADDLFRVGTLGFRGEALASIAEVSRLVLRSRPHSETAGAEIEVTGGRATPVAPCGCPPGTSIEVHNLFYNTPVRQKFLRTAQTEAGHIAEAVTRLALAHPAVHFTLRHGSREVYDLPPVEHWPDRIAALFGPELAESLIWVESVNGPVRLFGYAANPGQNRANPRMQYLFLNGRSIRDRSLQHALGEAYRGLLLTGRYPITFLHFTMPPEAVDVNVHPTKLEVRFQDGGALYSQLLGTLRTRFLTSDLTARLQPGAAAGAAEPYEAAQAHDADRAAQLRSELVQWAKGQLAVAGAPVVLADSTAAPSPYEIHQPHLDLSYPRPNHAPLELTSLGRTWKPVGAVEIDPWPEAPAAAPPIANGANDSAAVAPASYFTARPVSAMQVHNRYLIAESDEGVVVIDQHALHERILYEQIRAKVLAGAVEAQRLLVPEPVDLCPAEAAAVLSQQELLAQLGVQIEPFGGDTVLVTSYPAMLSGMSPAEVLRDVVHHLTSEGKPPERRDLLDELLHMVACKAAIKAGDRLSPEEVAALVEQRHLAQDAHHCPHGRPTALVFTREELDKQFMRT